MEEVDLEFVCDAVVKAQRDASYMESTIGQTKIAIREMLALAAKENTTTYTKEFGNKFASTTVSPKTGKFSMRRKRLFGRMARLCDSYLDTEIINLAPQKRVVAVEFKSQEFKKVFDCWRTDMKLRSLADNTQNYYGRLTSDYLLFLEERGVNGLEDAGPDTVLDFIVYLKTGAWSGTSTYHLVSNFRPFIKYLGRQDLLDALKLVHAKRERKITPVLKPDEQKAMSDTCCSGTVSNRDAAITLLCMTSGIRACDVVGMTLEDIDWVGGAIVMTQEKTDNPLTVPLLPAVGNALCRYVLDERPHSEDKHVFLRSLAPFTKLADHASVYAIIERVQIAANIEKAPCGSRILRHNAASKMLQSGIPLPTIAAVLGHADPESTDTYLSTDAEGMRMCVLPLPIGAKK